MLAAASGRGRRTGLQDAGPDRRHHRAEDRRKLSSPRLPTGAVRTGRAQSPDTSDVSTPRVGRRPGPTQVSHRHAGVRHRRDPVARGGPSRPKHHEQHSEKCEDGEAGEFQNGRDPGETDPPSRGCADWSELGSVELGGFGASGFRQRERRHESAASFAADEGRGERGSAPCPGHQDGGGFTDRALFSGCRGRTSVPVRVTQTIAINCIDHDILCRASCAVNWSAARSGDMCCRVAVDFRCRHLRERARRPSRLPTRGSSAPSTVRHRNIGRSLLLG